METHVKIWMPKNGIASLQFAATMLYSGTIRSRKLVSNGKWPMAMLLYRWTNRKAPASDDSWQRFVAWAVFHGKSGCFLKQPPIIQVIPSYYHGHHGLRLPTNFRHHEDHGFASHPIHDPRPLPAWCRHSNGRLGFLGSPVVFNASRISPRLQPNCSSIPDG